MKRANPEAGTQGRTSRRNGAWMWLGPAAAACAPAAALPIYNTDLFWHLRAGAEILSTRAVPRTAWTFVGGAVPWVDFEWLSQAVFAALHALGGFWALWLWKSALVVAAAGMTDGTLEDAGLGTPARAAGLAAWGAAAIYFADARPELYSIVLLAALLRRLESARREWGLALTAAFLGTQTLSHARFAALFAAPAALTALLAAHGAGLLQKRAARPLLAAVVAAAVAYVTWMAPHMPQERPFAFDLVPAQAAGFLESERAVVERLHPYAEWGWGGYLSWRLRPWYPLYVDGRYVFHGRLQPKREALQAGPRAWEAFLASQGVDSALVSADEDDYPRLVRPDGSPLGLPWHRVFLPPPRWALVYRDPKALFFVRRDAVPGPWLKGHELGR